MSAPLLQVDNIKTGYGPIDVLHGLSLTVNEGEIVTLIGANGAGKTSTLMCISGIQPLRGGCIRFLGEDIGRTPAHVLVGKGLAQVPEGRKIFPRLSVAENLDMGAYLRRDKDGIAADQERVYALFPVLRDRRRQLGGTLSGGEQQMLAIGRALMSRPRLLVMDEPSMGVAPLLVAKIFEAVRALNEQGMTILLVEQNACAALKLAQRGYVLEGGRIALEDTAAQLLCDPRVRAAYLGEAL